MRKVHTPDRYKVKPYVLAVLWCYLNPIISSSACIPLSLCLSPSLSPSNLNLLAPFQTKIRGTPQLLRLGRKTRSQKQQNHRRSCGCRPGSIPHTWVLETVPAVEPRVGVVCKKTGGPLESMRYLRVRRLNTIWSRRRRRRCWLYRRLSHWTMAPSVRFQKIPACRFISCCVHGTRTLLHTQNCRQRLYFPPCCQQVGTCPRGAEFPTQWKAEITIWSENDAFCRTKWMKRCFGEKKTKTKKRCFFLRKHLCYSKVSFYASVTVVCTMLLERTTRFSFVSPETAQSPPKWY